jgi:hypothetical protein
MNAASFHRSKWNNPRTITKHIVSYSTGTLHPKKHCVICQKTGLWAFRWSEGIYQQIIGPGKRRRAYLPAPNGYGSAKLARLGGIKASLLLAKVAERESINAARDEGDREVELIAKQQRDSVAAVWFPMENDGR